MKAWISCACAGARVAADIACARCYEVEIFESVDAAREMRRVVHPLFRAEPHVFVSSAHPLARRRQVLLEDLEDYPCLSFEQGTYNSFYFSEEILSTIVHRKEIHVSDRATLFNLLIGLNGYTICSGVLSEDLNGSNIISIPLKTKEYMLVGWIDREQSRPSRSALLYIEELKRVITEYGYEVIRTDD